MTLKDWEDQWAYNEVVRAKSKIYPSPLSDCRPVSKGTIGTIEDIVDGYIWVDFGHTVEPCYPNEIEVE